MSLQGLVFVLLKSSLALQVGSSPLRRAASRTAKDTTPASVHSIPMVFTPRQDAPVVELLHPVACDPQTRSLTCRVIRQVGTARFQVADQILQRLHNSSSPPSVRAGSPTPH